MNELEFAQQRCRLVKTELRHLGIHDPRVLRAMLQVPREEFVCDELREYAYRNAPLSIGFGQTISQPFIVAFMAQEMCLSPQDRVLEVGAGCGYAAAVLSQIVAQVFAIERLGDLATAAEERRHRLGFHNVHIRQGDGTLGWPEHAPFDAILVSAASTRIPPALLHQLRTGGRLLIPLGEDHDAQQLVRVTRRGEENFDQEDLGSVRFVPLIGSAV